MRFSGRAASVVVVGLSLVTTSPSEGQNAASPKASVGSTAPEGATTEHSLGAGAQGSLKAAEDPKTASSSDGYTWRKEKRQQKHERQRIRFDPKRPLVQAPSFRMMSDGTSVVSLAISQNVPVAEKVTGMRLEYRLSTAQVGVANNLNPLVTGHFPTPLLRAALRRVKDGVVLVMLLRESATPRHVVRAGAGGTVLEITLPKPTRAVQAPTPMSSARRERKSTRPAPSEPTGPGPKL